MSPMVSEGYAPVDGVDVYWCSEGEGGTPLVLVHGGFGVTGTFGDLVPRWAADRRVVSIELQGHGHTRDVDRPFTFDGFGDQVAGVVTHLGLGSADLLGYSLGGLSCISAAARHADVVRRLVLVSVPCRRDGWYPEVLEGMAGVNSGLFDQFRQSPLYAAYAAVAPDVDAFPRLMDKSGELLRQPYDWCDDIAAFGMPTMLVCGDADSIPTSHLAEFYGLLASPSSPTSSPVSSPDGTRAGIDPPRVHPRRLGCLGFRVWRSSTTSWSCCTSSAWRSSSARGSPSSGRRACCRGCSTARSPSS